MTDRVPDLRLVSFAGLPVDGQLDLTTARSAGIVLEPRYDLWNSGDEGLVAEALQGCWGVIAGGERITRRVLDTTADLRVILRPGLGYDNVDVAAATEHGVLVLNTPGTIEPAVAELTLGLILAGRRKVLAHDHSMREGRWRPVDYMSDGLVGATVGLIGLGRIGREVARRLAGFDCRVIATDPAVDVAEWATRGIEVVPLDVLLEASDVVSIHVPLMTETTHMIGERELRRMRQGAMLVNTARGGIVDEAALVRALSEQTIAGAAIDAFEIEPIPSTSPLLQMPNVVLSPHIGWATRAATLAMHQLAVDTAVRVARGEVPPNAINPSATQMVHAPTGG